MSDDYFQLYLDEIALIPPLGPDEEAQLLARSKEGDEAAKNRLTEGLLAYIVELVKACSDCGLPMGDLVQEANVALIMAVDSWQPGQDFRSLLKSHVTAALEAAIKEQELEAKVEEEILARVNVLKEISRQMAEELGREATVPELAAKMKLTEEEIRDIMKLTLDAMSVSPDVEA